MLSWVWYLSSRLISSEKRLWHIVKNCMKLFLNDEVWNISTVTTKMTSIWPKTQKIKKTADLPCPQNDRQVKMTALSDARTVPKCLIKNTVPFKSQKTRPLRGNDSSKPAGVFVCTNLQISVWRHNDSCLRHMNHQKCHNISKVNYGQLWMTRKDPPEAEIWQWPFWTLQPK